MEEFIQIIKDYGAAIISAISVGGVATIGVIITKVYKAFNSLKEKTNSLLAKKDKALEESSTEVKTVVEQNKQLLGKIDDLTNDVYKLKSEVRDNVKGNRKN